MDPLLTSAAVYAALAATGLGYDALLRRRHPPRGRTVATADGVRHVVEAGEGPPVLLLHGANGTSSDFSEELITALAGEFRVVVVDRPGHGHSARSHAGRLDLAGEARATIALLDALELPGALLLGHSYGAAVALRAALDAPARVGGVLAVAPIGCVSGSTRVWVTLAGLGPVADAAVLALGVPVGRFASPGVRADAWHPAPPPQGWSAARSFPLSPIQIQSSLGNLRALERDLIRLRADLPGCRVPAQVLAAVGDRLTPCEPNAGALAEAGGLPIERVPDAGHWLVRTHVAHVRLALCALAARRAGPLPT